ncbi:MAG: hypothetical protein LAT66_11630 [Alkalimonas sp.]|nr:hypothetical protein [Alkalimonas sp.]
MSLLRSLTRIPSVKFDQELATGDTIIDDYLKALDAELVGAKTVRNVTLAEARDHLLEHKAVLLNDGIDDTTASTKAVASFGSAAEHGGDQRQQRRKLYFKMMVSMGLPFASLMTIFAVLAPTSRELPWLMHAVMFLFQFVFFGGLMSAWFTLGFAQARPTQSIDTIAEGETLEVYSPRVSKVAALFLSFFMGCIGVSALLGAFGLSFMAYNHMAVNIFLAYLAFSMVAGAPLAFSKLFVQGDTLTLKTPFSQRDIPLQQLVAIAPVPAWQRWFRIALGQIYVLRLRNEQGVESKTTLVLNGEMHNSDQLLALLNSKAAAQHG